MPFVFTARGRVHLSPAPLPPPNFAPPLKLKQATTKPKKAPVSRRLSSSKLSRESRRTLADIEADGNSDSESESSRPFDENHPFVTSNYDDEISSGTEEEEDDSDGEEDIDAALNPDKWNEPEDAFEEYLAWFMGPPPDAEEEDKENSRSSVLSTPGLTLSSSPGSIPSSSSPFRSSSPPSRPSSAFDLYSPSSFPLSDHYPNTKYKYTPAPPKAKVARMRIERVQKRMEKAKKDKWLCARDESPDLAGAAGIDVDELFDEDEDDDDDDVADDGKWVKPVLKPGEVWDPFGDELEI